MQNRFVITIDDQPIYLYFAIIGLNLVRTIPQSQIEIIISLSNMSTSYEANILLINSENNYKEYAFLFLPSTQNDDAYAHKWIFCFYTFLFSR